MSERSRKPNDAMVSEAKRGLAWRREFGRGGTEVGIARARDIANRKELSPRTIARMRSYFARHEVDKKGQGWSPGEKGYPSNGRIAWALWGGDPGKSFADARAVTSSAGSGIDERAREQLRRRVHGPIEELIEGVNDVVEQMDIDDLWDAKRSDPYMDAAVQEKLDMLRKRVRG